MKLPTPQEVTAWIDVSAVQAYDDETAVSSAVHAALRFNCKSVIVLPAWLPLAAEILNRLGTDRGDEMKLGGCVGFPSGGVTTAVKVFETHEQVQIGSAEIDMTINLGQLLSGRVDMVRGEICTVVAAAAPRPVKVILECHYLNADQIRTACDLCIQAEAVFVKTGTGGRYRRHSREYQPDQGACW